MIRAEQETDFLLLDSGARFSSLTVKNGQDDSDTTVIDQYDWPTYDALSKGHKFLIVDEYVDQELMLKHKEKLQQFLDAGNILFFAGHLFRLWIPGAGCFIPKPISSYKDYKVEMIGHPVFDGVRSEDITYNKGVAGFFCRGHHPLPEGAEVMLELAGGIPITYTDRNSSKGVIVLHAGRNLLSKGKPDNTSARIRPQLLAWLYKEYKALQDRKAVEII